MTEALSMPHGENMTSPPPLRATGPSLRSVALETPKTVDIIAPDQYCAALLLQEAAKSFPAELAPGSDCVVRLQPPAGGQWAVEVLALVERWLASVPLPCTKVFYGDTSYLIRAQTKTEVRECCG